MNRSVFYLKTNQFDSALADAESGLKNQNNIKKEKGFYRKAEALYNLQRYQECHDILKVLCAEYPSLAEAQVKLKQTLTRLEEQNSGQYDFT